MRNDFHLTAAVCLKVQWLNSAVLYRGRNKGRLSPNSETTCGSPWAQMGACSQSLKCLQIFNCNIVWIFLSLWDCWYMLLGIHMFQFANSAVLLCYRYDNNFHAARHVQVPVLWRTLLPMCPFFKAIFGSHLSRLLAERSCFRAPIVTKEGDYFLLTSLTPYIYCG